MALDCGLELDRSVPSNLPEASSVPAAGLDEWPIVRAVVIAGDCGMEFDRSVLSNLLESSFVPAELDEWPIARAVVSGYT